MPKLKQLTCSIDLGPDDVKLKEYGHRYSDGVVETFIAVPDRQAPFSVHLQSHGYIAPGLSAWIFIDGAYHVNRNKIGLKVPNEGVRLDQTEVDMRIRQKEEKTNRGTFVSRDWTFTALDTRTADKCPTVNGRFLGNVGTIEIVVLRCKDDGMSVPPSKPSNDDEPKEQPEQQKKKMKQKQQKQQNQPNQAPAAKVSAAPASAAPSRAASAREEDFGIGGMFGIFDGASDDLPPDAPEACPDLILDGAMSETTGTTRRVERIQYADFQPGITLISTVREARAWYTRFHDQLESNNHLQATFQSQLTESGHDESRQKYFSAQIADLRKKESELRSRITEVKVVIQQFEAEDKEAARPASTRPHVTHVEHEPTGYSQPPQSAHQPPPTDYLERLRQQYAILEKAVGGDPAVKTSPLQPLPGRSDQLDTPPWMRPFNLPQVDGMQYKGDGVYRPPRFKDLNSPVLAGWHGLSRAGSQTGNKRWQADNGGDAWDSAGDAKGSGGQDNDWHKDNNGWNTKGNLWGEQDNVQKQNDHAQGTPHDAGKALSGAKNARPWDKNRKSMSWGDDHNAGQSGGKSQASHRSHNRPSNHKNKWQDGRSRPASHCSQSRNQSDGGYGHDPSQAEGQSGREKANDNRSQHNDYTAAWAGSSDGPSGANPLKEGWTLGSADSNAHVKSYWEDGCKQTGGKPSDSQPQKHQPPRRQIFEYPATPLPRVPEGKVHGATHGVQPGKGAEYSHNCNRPNYLDDVTKPYAVFSFKYRSKAALKKILGVKVDSETKQNDKQVDMDTLLAMPKHKLIEELMHARGSRSKSSTAASQQGGSRAHGSVKSERGRKDQNSGNDAGGWVANGSTKSNKGGGWIDVGTPKTAEHNFAGVDQGGNGGQDNVW